MKKEVDIFIGRMKNCEGFHITNCRELKKSLRRLCRRQGFIIETHLKTLEGQETVLVVKWGGWVLEDWKVLC